MVETRTELQRQIATRESHTLSQAKKNAQQLASEPA